MAEPTRILLGGSDAGQEHLIASMGNRHGLIAGATGTGKTVSLQVLAEGFSRIGVPVFMADVKGDLSGLAKPANPHPKIDERIEKIGITDYRAGPSPVVFWDLDGENGHPIRATISDLGPLLLSNLFELNETQTGVLYTAFRIADENGLLLLDLKDLRAMLAWMAEHNKEISSEYGNVSKASVGAIQRRLLVLEEEGGEKFFGEPAIKLDDLMMTDFSGNGVISVLDVTRLVSESPRLYATFLLWLLAELFENLPEVGDADKPKFVFFFDEAHLLFDRAPNALLDKIEQVVRLIRSKGVGIYFITQSPLDIPNDVLGQLGCKVQHALRAFTPRDKKAVKTVAETFRQNPELDIQSAITELGIGEALVSVLDADGSPTVVQQVLMRPPESRIGPLTAEERTEAIGRSPMKGRYDEEIDRESAYEKLRQRAEDEAKQDIVEAAEKARAKEQKKSKSRSRRSDSVGEALLKSVVRSAGSQMARTLVRGALGSLLGGRRR